MRLVVLPVGQGTTTEQKAHTARYCGSSRKRCCVQTNDRPLELGTAGAQVYDLLLHSLFVVAAAVSEFANVPSGTWDIAPCVLLAASGCAWWMVAPALQRCVPCPRPRAFS